MSILVIILNQDTKECDPNVDDLKDIFNDSFYIVRVMDDYYDALLYAYQKHPLLPCLIIRDNSIILHDIKPHLQKCLTLEADIHFLCTWGDSCHRYTNAIKGIKYTTVSYASQAVLYMPQSRKRIIKGLEKYPIEKVLKHYTSNKDCKDGKEHQCTAFIPNIVHFDIDLAKSNDDYLKLNGALPIDINNLEEDNNQLVWIFILIVTIILLSILVPYYKKHRCL